MVELLSPVGNMECLKSAINAGCDAVYLAGKNFGARSFAGNFTNEELVSAIEICHLYGIKVYVTVNTIIYDPEVEHFIKYIDFLHRNNVDAIIMQDIGMIDLVRKTYPNLKIHASTQMNIHNIEGVKLCEKLGITRVVLARETPIELIKYIKENTNMEIEVFIHGALCMSYSGQCLMSSLIGNRSGNRGTCAQPCRQPYSLIVNNKVVEDNKYLLSTKDLNTLEYINQLIDLKIDSLKIEGRMKSKEYVYLVTNTYRRIIDNYIKTRKVNITEQDIKELKKIFNREFTKGFMFNEDNQSFTNTYRPNNLGIKLGKVIDYKNNKIKIKLIEDLDVQDGIRIIDEKDIGFLVTSIIKNNKQVKEAYKGDIVEIPFKEKITKNSTVLKTLSIKQVKDLDNKIKIDRKVSISLKCILKLGNTIKLEIRDNNNNIVVKTSDYIVEASKASETTSDLIEKQLTKLGDTIYQFDHLIINKDDNIFIPIYVLNELRRCAIEELNNKRLYKIDYKKEEYKIDVPNFKHIKEKSTLISTYNEYLNINDDIDTIYVEDLSLFKTLKDKRCVLKLNRVLEHLENYSENTRLLISDYGSLYKYKNVYTDFPFNVVNSYSVALLHSMGVKKVTLSYELNFKQVKRLIENYEKRYNTHPSLEVIVSGFEEVMVSKYNLLKNYNTDTGFLKDKFNNKYKIKVKDNLMYIYNYKKRDEKEDYYSIGVNSIRY